MPMTLRIDGDSLDISASEAVWGGVWLEIDGHPFPETKWNDLVLALVTELLEALRDAGRGGGRRVRFFDGPHWIDLRGDDDGSVRLSTSDQHATTIAATDLPGVIGQVQDTARELVALCERRGWSDLHDVRRLRLLTGG